VTDAHAPRQPTAEAELEDVDRATRPTTGVFHPDRLAVVEAVGALPIWEEATQRALDRVARLAAHIFGAWQALVTLLDADALVIVSASGDGPFKSGERCPIATTLCHVVVQRGEPLLVADARNDPRFRAFPEVAEQGVVAYAGVPLIVDGAVVGTVVVIDHEPREWPPFAASTLSDLAEAAVTELQLRAALRNERSFASLADHLPDSVSRVDRDLRYVYVNPVFASSLNRTIDDIVGQDLGTIVEDERLGRRWRRDVQQTLESGVPMTTTYELHCQDGRRSYEVRFLPEHDLDGEVCAVLCISRDMTPQVEAERQMRNSAAQLHAIFSQAIVGVFTAQDDRFVYANPRLATILGYDTPDDLLAIDSLAQVVAPESRDRVMEILSDPYTHVTGAKPYHFTGLRRDGVRIDVEAHGAAADVNGKPAVIGIILDVTSRNALELQLRQAQKMEAVGQLAAGVAHDFNNLLAAVVANAHLALEDLEHGRVNADDLHGILDAAGRAAELTRRLLAFGRHDPIRPETLDLGAIIRGMEALLRRVLPDSTHLALLAEGPPLPICADRAQIEQVVMNLVLNARDAMPDGGTITVETSLETHADLGAAATLVVSDTGVGMDARTRERIFEPFFTTKERGRGTGLGLTTVHTVVEQLHGRIAVESEPAAGAVFRLAIPLAAEVAPSERRVEAPPRIRTDAVVGGAPPIVLLAEDEEAVRRTSKRMLERAGYHVLAARHGADALRMLEQVKGAVDVLVSDVSMPELDGVSLATRARIQVPDLGVIFVSGYTDILNEATLRALDAAFLAKPFSAEALTRAVAEMLARRAR
jgi:two-component system, cell cycle sensor histidine kinase and response regulator CckA